MLPRVFLVALVALALCGVSVHAGVSCYDGAAPAGAPKVGECVAVGACATTANKRSVDGLCGITPATPVCCLNQKPVTRPTTAAPAAAAPKPAAPATPIQCIAYSPLYSGQFSKGECGPSDGSCPSGLVGAADTNCAAYSPKRRCCYSASSIGTPFIVPSKPPARVEVLAPTDLWRLEFVDNGAGALWVNRTEYKNGKSVVTGRLPYAEGQLRVINGKGEVLDSFSVVSGPMGRGLLPNEAGSGYTVSLKEGPKRATSFPDEAGFGFKYFINPNKPAGFGRTALLIHPTSNPGTYGGQTKLRGATEGCIGLNDGHARNVEFYNLLQGYLNRARSIRLDVKIANNPNVGRK